MVRGTSDILTWFENTGMPYWRIYPHKNIAGGNMVLEGKQEEGQSAGDALEDLKYKLRVINRGYYTIAAFPEPNKLPTKGYHKTDIELPQSEPHQHAISGPVGISPDDVQRQINQALTAYKQEVELNDMRSKVKELEKQNKELLESVNSPWNKVVGALAPYAPQIMGNIFPQAKVAGLPTPDPGPVDNQVAEPTELTPEQSEVISTFISVLSDADTDYLNTLRRLTKKIEEQPSIITMVKNFI